MGRHHDGLLIAVKWRRVVEERHIWRGTVEEARARYGL